MYDITLKDTMQNRENVPSVSSSIFLTLWHYLFKKSFSLVDISKNLTILDEIST